MRLIPQIVIPLAFASLVQNLSSISERSSAGAIIVFLSFLFWHLFVSRTRRGQMVFDAWVVNLNKKIEKQHEDYEPTFIDLANHEDVMHSRIGEYSSYSLWKKYIEQDKSLRSRIDIDFFAEELLEIDAIIASEKINSRQQTLYKIKSEEMIEEHVKKYFERPFGWQSFMALKRKFTRRKSA